MAELHVSITGDCTGLSNAIDSSHAKIDSLDGRTAGVIVGLQGAAATVTGLNQVATAAGSVPTQVNLGVNSSGVAQASSDFSGLRDEARGLGRDMDALSGSRTIGLSNDGSFRTLAGDLSQVSSGYANFGSSAESGLRQASSGNQDFTRSLSAQREEMSQADRVGTSFNSTIGDIERSSSGALQPIQQLAQSATMLADGGSAAADTARDMESAFGGAGKAASKMSDEAWAANRALSAGQIGAAFDAFAGESSGVGIPGTGHGPPRSPGSGGGGGGGGEGGGFFGGGSGEGSGESLSAHGLMQGAQMGLMVGAVDEMIGAGAGLFAVNEAIKDVPGLARAANQAMGEFNKGVQQTASSALGEGVPALHALGAALGPLGQEVGRIGAENMGTAVNGLTELATTATSTLQALEPAIGPALSGAISLGNAFLQGVASPAVVGAIKGIGDTLQNADVATGITDLTAGLLTAGGVVTQVAADAVGSAASVLTALLGTSGGEAAAPALTGGAIGALTLGKAFGGGLGGAGIAGALGAAAIGIGSYQQQQNQDPTAGIVGEAGAALLGRKAFGPAGALLGIGGDAAVAGLENTSGSGDAGEMLSDVLLGAGLGATVGGPIGGMVGALGGGAYGIYKAIQDRKNQTGGFTPGSISSGASSGSGAFPSGQTAGKYGWQADAQGNLTPSDSPTGGSSAPYDPNAQFQGASAPTTTALSSPGASRPWLGGSAGSVGTPVNPSDIPSSMLAPPIPPSAGPSNILDPSQNQQPLGPGLNPLGPGATPTSPDQVPASMLAPPPPKPLTTAPMGGGQGAGTSFGTLSPATVQSLNTALGVTPQAMQQTASASQQLSSGLQNVPQAAQQVSQGLQQVGQASQQVSQPMQQVQQHMQNATQAVQQMTAQAPQALSQVAQIAPAVQKTMSEAAPQIQSAGQSMGAQIPSSMGEGITNNQQAACTAAQKLGDGTLNCGKASVAAASPSKLFMELGTNISQGLAIGIENSTPQAVAAIQSSMAQVVAAGQSGLETASPSKTFQAYGEQAVNNVAQGAVNVTPAVVNEAAQRQQILARQTAATLPQGKLQQASNDEQQKQQDEAQKEQEKKQLEARDKQLQGLGYNEKTRKKVEDDEKKRKDIKDAADKRQRDEQQTAMQRAGIPIQPMGSNQPLTPMQQYWAMQKKKSDDAKTTALDKLNAPPGSRPPGDITPGQKFANDEKIKHDAAADVAKNALKNSGFDPGTKSTGFGDPSKGQNNSGYADAKAKGKGATDGFKDGAKDGGDGPAGATSDAAQKAIDAAKNKTQTHSPSQVFYGIGSDLMAGLSNGVTASGGSVQASIGDVMSGALGSGVTAASNSVMGIASNAGLAVGYQWARNVVTGADSVLKSADFQQVALPQVGSALATTALGTAGLLPASGAGGSIPNSQTVTMSGGTPAAAPVVNNYITLDGQQLRAMTRTEVITALGQVADSIPQQVG
jgi:hypothetical protein